MSSLPLDRSRLRYATGGDDSDMSDVLVCDATFVLRGLSSRTDLNNRIVSALGSPREDGRMPVRLLVALHGVNEKVWARQENLLHLPVDCDLESYAQDSPDADKLDVRMFWAANKDTVLVAPGIRLCAT